MLHYLKLAVFIFFSVLNLIGDLTCLAIVAGPFAVFCWLVVYPEIRDRLGRLAAVLLTPSLFLGFFYVLGFYIATD
jgi:hypothetical protein